MELTNLKDIFREPEKWFNQKVSIGGWVRSNRSSKAFGFLTVSDGTFFTPVQVVYHDTMDNFAEISHVNVGAALIVEGTLIPTPEAKQPFEIQADCVAVEGPSGSDYPLQKKRHTLEYLRTISHLRPRTNTFQAVFRVRSLTAYAIHKFFQERGFVYAHTPIISCSDCEGAGEMFQVTTLDLNNIPRDEQGNVDYKQDFFGKSTNLTVSGQLEGELAATALGKIYTFGPTFRAENSNTTRHLAEFWMIEPEMAFYDINDNMDLAEEMLKYLIQYALDNNMDDLQFLSKRLQDEEKGKKEEEKSMELISKLHFVLEHEFVRLTYTEAIDILRNSNYNKKGKFQYPVTGWGIDLQSEHERYLVEKHFQKPVILTDYPKEIKAFYMKQNEDGKTVRAMDVLFPGIGEIIGGSERETDINKILERMHEVGIPEESMNWYLDSRRFGSVPHSGYGLGFERLLLFITGMTNIRDVIPFPRTPKNCLY
jgi:asparaginyl-tRNA synthetase